MSIELSGETRLFPIVGDPIAQVRSPKYLTEIMASRGINGIVPPVHVAPSELAGFFATAKAIQNLDGIVITLPHKIDSLAFCDRVTKRASVIGAVNVTRRMADGSFYGDNTDGEAYVAAIRNRGGEPEGKQVLQIGVGGAGSAVAYEFLAQGVATLYIFDVDAARLSQAVTKLDAVFPGRVRAAESNSPKGMNIVANVTPVGMKESDPTPVPLDELTSDMMFGDALTKPAISKTGEFARSIGCKAMAGADMFDAQAETLVNFMTDDESKFLSGFELL